MPGVRIVVGFAFVLYISVSILLCILLPENPVIKNFTKKTEIEAKETNWNQRNFKVIDDDNSFPGSLGGLNYTIRVFHTSLSLCDVMPEDLSFTPSDVDQHIAIMLSTAECSIEQKAETIVKFYKEDNPSLKHVLLYNDEQEETAIVPLMIRRDLPLSIFMIPSITASTLLGDMKTDPTFPLASKSVNTNFIRQSNADVGDKPRPISAPMITFMRLIRKLVFSYIITALALVITGATILWLWGNQLSIHVSWSGVDLIYLSDEEPAAKKKLMTEAQVLSFPEIRYTCNGGTCIPVDDDSSHDEENPSSGPLTCSICIEDFEEGELVRVTPCGHHYHTDCIMPWLTTRSADCPVCKESFVEDEGVKKE